MTDERKTEIFLEPPLHDADLPEETKQNIIKIATLEEFISNVVDPNVDVNTSHLRGGVDWGSEIETFNKGGGGPEISLDEVANRLERTRWPEDRVEQDLRIAGQLRDWLQRDK